MWLVLGSINHSISHQSANKIQKNRTCSRKMWSCSRCQWFIVNKDQNRKLICEHSAQRDRSCDRSEKPFSWNRQSIRWPMGNAKFSWLKLWDVSLLAADVDVIRSEWNRSVPCRTLLIDVTTRKTRGLSTICTRWHMMSTKVWTLSDYSVHLQTK